MTVFEQSNYFQRITVNTFEIDEIVDCLRFK